MRFVLPPLVLLLGACAQSPSPRPIPVLAEQHRCPAFPLPPKELLKPPAKIDFLSETGS